MVNVPLVRATTLQPLYDVARNLNTNIYLYISPALNILTDHRLSVNLDNSLTAGFRTGSQLCKIIVTVVISDTPLQRNVSTLTTQWPIVFSIVLYPYTPSSTSSQQSVYQMRKGSLTKKRLSLGAGGWPLVNWPLVRSHRLLVPRAYSDHRQRCR